MAVRTLAFVSIAAATIQCIDNTGPRVLDNRIGVIVSGLIAPRPGATAAQRSPSSAAGFAYVSLPPSSVPAGIAATVTNRAMGVVVTTAMLNGGFDPVAIGANIGDTLGVDITTSSPDTAAHARLVVAARRSPRVVRTNPPQGEHDVPLNATIVVVFSEPIDPVTLNAGIALYVRDTVPVAGTVGFADAAQLKVAFTPATQLTPQTTYRLAVTQAIRDVNGLTLDSAAVVSFTSGLAAQSAAKLAFTVQPSDAVTDVAVSPSVVVAIQDASGNTVTSASDAVTVALAANPGGGSLWGTTTVNALNGLATFSLAINRPGTGYTLKASSGTLTSVISAQFAITPPGTAPVLHITTTTTGTGAYVPSGYDLCVDPGYYTPGCYAHSAIGGNSAVTVPVDPGTHVVQLDVADNCAVSDDDPRTVTASNGVTEVPFAVTCGAPGSVHVTTATTGTDVDPDGYRVCVDRSGNPCYWSTHANGNDDVYVAGVGLGPHTVSVDGVAGNCTIGGGAARAVTVPAGGIVNVAFDVGCVLAVPPALHVTTTTTGANVPSGYYLCVDPGYYTPGCYAYLAIGVNSAVTVPVEPGTHVVKLDVANCAVSGDDPRTVTASNGVTEVPFAVTCAALGSVRVTTAHGDGPEWRPHR